MKRYSLIFGLVALFGFGSVSVFAQGAAGNGHGLGLDRILCFSGTDDGGIYGGTCTLNSTGARRTAVLTTNDGDADGSYAGVYSNSRSIYGKPLTSIGMLRFTFSGDAASAGSPRFSVPIDTDADGDTDIWAYISAFYCSDREGRVSARNTGCTIYTSDGGSYQGLRELIAAYPGAVIANDNYVFIISDEPGTWTISNVSFGAPGFGHVR
jgi:hypothetical protein